MFVSSFSAGSPFIVFQLAGDDAPLPDGICGIGLAPVLPRKNSSSFLMWSGKG
jgi:hypothetical protein